MIYFIMRSAYMNQVVPTSTRMWATVVAINGGIRQTTVIGKTGKVIGFTIKTDNLTFVIFISAAGKKLQTIHN